MWKERLLTKLAEDHSGSEKLGSNIENRITKEEIQGEVGNNGTLKAHFR